MKILQSVFLFFARYPDHIGVMKNFNKTSPPKNYVDFQKEARELPLKNLLPEISDYVFGVTDAAVKKRIQAITGTYLFVDYGNIRTTRNDQKVKTDSLDISVTIAKPLSSNFIDAMEEILMVDRHLELLSTIREDMLLNKEDPFVKLLTFPTEILPFSSAELNNSYGFSMIFQLQGVQMI